MNYYENELERIRRNFNFSMKIYDREPIMQLALCQEEIKKLSRMKFPQIYFGLYAQRTKLRDKIQSIYMKLKEESRNGDIQ